MELRDKRKGGKKQHRRWSERGGNWEVQVEVQARNAMHIIINPLIDHRPNNSDHNNVRRMILARAGGIENDTCPMSPPPHKAPVSVARCCRGLPIE